MNTTKQLRVTLDVSSRKHDHYFFFSFYCCITFIYTFYFIVKPLHSNDVMGMDNLFTNAQDWTGQRVGGGGAKEVDRRVGESCRSGPECGSKL